MSLERHIFCSLSNHRNLKHHKYLKPWEDVELLFVLIVDNKEKVKFISMDAL